ncbi:Polyketide cyclase / dehydrase and lipid transport [Palleronia marisminoris]|uniref:Polyketide cyclase / dehydrase and lipid transport n=1 Tax=Palleronia marisminoris TaxID=315423 RepID=A0A1Y5TJA0_9RHOB|nr:SRPBCC family protein [Palleronia marisminoris]SFH42433.1 Polyketide cyclase / dehydrase and lipid transport [Palleronia marisminoris]SLN65470.1 Polyketide cyclase / dehydrase and lipid transport [Palleronia marisminoris]
MYRDHRPKRRAAYRPEPGELWLAAGIGAIIGLAGASWYQIQTRNSVDRRLPDDAPLRTARSQPDRRRTVTGRTITIDRPRSELYEFWRDFKNLPQVMENVKDITADGDLSRWQIDGPGRDVSLVTAVTDDVPNERIAWSSTEASDIETRGQVSFRDAPAGRGTEVTLDLEYRAPGGALGRAVAKMFQSEPHLQARRDLKRLKMLMETGEIATNANRRSAA